MASSPIGFSFIIAIHSSIASFHRPKTTFGSVQKNQPIDNYFISGCSFNSLKNFRHSLMRL